MTGLVRRLGAGWWVYAVLAAVFLGVAAYGSVVVLRGPQDPQVTLSTATRPDRTPITPTVTPSASALATTTPASPAAVPVPVDPRCWATREASEDKGCQVAVVQKTKFVPRYMTNQSQLARQHPAVKLANVGRQANSLARHGLMICWMVQRPDLSLDDMRSAFYLSFHKHPFTVPNDDLDAAADSVLSVAVQDVCPSTAEAYERKGGPKAELVVP